MTKRSLLLVDGDAKSLRVLEVSLKKAGFNISTATTGIDALQKAADCPPDLVISDTDLPEMDGYGFCKEFKQNAEWSSIPFIFLTKEAAIENKIQGLELGVDDYLTKPIYIKEILTRVRILLQKHERTQLGTKKDQSTRFAGRLNDMGVVDLIQTIEVSRKTGVIYFRESDSRQATIFFKEGRVIDAETGHLQGAEAVYRILTWNDGEFEALFRAVRRRDIINMSSQALLMEGMRRLDEWGRLQEQLPPLHKKYEIVYEELWERLAELPDDLNSVLRLFDTRKTLSEVIDGSSMGDLEVVEIISKLYFEGILVEVGQELRDVSPARNSEEQEDDEGDSGASPITLGYDRTDEQDEDERELSTKMRRDETTDRLLDNAIIAATPVSDSDSPKKTLVGVPVARLALLTQEPPAPAIEISSKKIAPEELVEEKPEAMEIDADYGSEEESPLTLESFSRGTNPALQDRERMEVSGLVIIPNAPADAESANANSNANSNPRAEDTPKKSTAIDEGVTREAAISDKTLPVRGKDNAKGGIPLWFVGAAAVAAGLAFFIASNRSESGDRERAGSSQELIAKGISGEPQLPAHVVGKDVRVIVLDASIAEHGNDVATNPIVPGPSDAGSAASLQNQELSDADVVAKVREGQVQLLIKNARRAKQSGDRFEALQIIDDSLKMRKSSTALLFKAELLLDIGDSDSAATLVAELVRVAGRRPAVWRLKGYISRAKGNPAGARAAFARYLEMAPSAKDAAVIRKILREL